jgi:hypothetical protein
MPIALKRAFRLVFGLYVAVCTLVATLVFTGFASLITLDWATDPNRGAETKNMIAFNGLIHQAPKYIDVSKFNNDDWTLLCVLGRYAARTDIERIARRQGLKFDEIEIGRHGYQKSRATLVYIQKNGKVRWSLPDALQGQVGSGETVCVMPAAPILNLPTQSALKALKSEPG